jgi:CheY-like chemotaxis protein
VADDNVANQRVLARMLESWGARVDVAGTGREAVDMLRMMHYDLVLMDCEMPAVGGHQAIAEIRNRETTRRIRVVSMITSTLAPCGYICTECGIDDVLYKPVRMQDLCDVVKRWVPQAAAGSVTDTMSLPG